MRHYVRAPLAALLIWSAFAQAAHGQWIVGAGIRASRFSGAAVEPATGRSLRPYRPTMWELSVERRWGHVGMGLRVHYASSSLALEGREALAAVKHALTVYGVDPEVTARVTRIGPEGVLRLFAGPVLELWKLPDLGSRPRLGLSASLGLEVPFGGRWSGSARLGAVITPASPFHQEDLNDGLEPRALWRREVSAALRYRL